jgi:hypothetical protein
VVIIALSSFIGFIHGFSVVGLSKIGNILFKIHQLKDHLSGSKAMSITHFKGFAVCCFTNCSSSHAFSFLAGGTDGTNSSRLKYWPPLLFPKRQLYHSYLVLIHRSLLISMALMQQ